MFPCRSPPNWWTDELCILDVNFFADAIASMKQRGVKPSSLASAIITYTEKSLRDLVRDHSGRGVRFSDTVDNDSDERSLQRDLVESIVSLLPSDKGLFPINFLCSLLRCAIFLDTSLTCKNELEKRISVVLEHVSVDDLLVPSFTYDGERLLDLDSVRRIISSFVEKEKNVGVFNGGDFNKLCSVSLQRVAKTVDCYLAEIATYGELTISKFNAIANVVPKSARKSDDDLYRAIDIFLKAQPTLDEIEREKVCSSMDPLKLSYGARLHASQNKRLPVNIVLHALYYDQLKLRSGVEEEEVERAVVVLPEALKTRSQLQADRTLVKENEALRSELLKMKRYVSDMQKNQNGAGASSSNSSLLLVSNKKNKTTFFSSVSKKLGKLNPFRHGSKDTSNIDEDLAGVDITKPRRRRFSIS